MIQNRSICNGVARAAYACSLAVRPNLLRPNAADVDHYQSKCANTRRACSVAVLDEDVACSVAVLFSSKQCFSRSMSLVSQFQLEFPGRQENRPCIVARLSAWVEKDDTAILSFSHIVQSQLATPHFLRIYFWHEIQVESIDAITNEDVTLFMKSDVFSPWKSWRYFTTPLIRVLFGCCCDCLEILSHSFVKPTGSLPSLQV